MRKSNALLLALLLLATTYTTAAAAPTCQFWTSARGKLYARLNADPGGDGAVYIYVDGEQATYFSAQGRWFYVPWQKGQTARGYNSQLVMQCSR